MRATLVEEIERRLNNRFALLTGAERTAPERHRTLMAVIDWSWNLLSVARVSLREPEHRFDALSHAGDRARVRGAGAGGLGCNATSIMMLGPTISHCRGPPRRRPGSPQPHATKTCLSTEDLASRRLAHARARYSECGSHAGQLCRPQVGQDGFSARTYSCAGMSSQ